MRAAIIYDFDGTLARGSLQERSFIPQIGMTRESFWTEVKERTRNEDADEILVYMHLMIEKARNSGLAITREQLRKHGEDAELFDGLRDRSWFHRMNQYAAQAGLQLDHYILSSGIHEMIVGCPIVDSFKWVYASKYIYEGDQACWPGVAINYTTKTQFLFRINKGIENTWNHADLNAFMPEQQRPVPFSRMIFIGDGDTDIPTMKMLTHQGGHSIAVYDPKREHSDLKKIHALISDGRVDFIAAADYTEKSQLDIIIKGILGRISRHIQSQRPPKKISVD